MKLIEAVHSYIFELERIKEELRKMRLVCTGLPCLDREILSFHEDIDDAVSNIKLALDKLYFLKAIDRLLHTELAALKAKEGEQHGGNITQSS